MLSNIEKKLKQTAETNPLTKIEKNLLWAKIENNLKSNQLSTFFNLKPKFAFASLMSLALIGTSAAVVGASNDAGPGDVLYPIDLAIEKVRIVFAKKEIKDNLRLKFAEERLGEARRALAFKGINNNPNLDSANITTTTQDGMLNLKNIERHNFTLDNTIDRLEKTKELLEEKGNAIATQKINDMIEKLTELAEEHVANLDEFEIKIQENNGNKAEIQAFRQKIKVKFEHHFKGKGVEKVTICHIPQEDCDEDCNASHTITIAEPALQAHLDHGDYLGECENGDQNGDEDNDNNDDDNATSTPDITAPVILDISSSVSTNTADINWNTDENSDSMVWYSTTTPLFISTTTPLISSTELVVNHTISLSNLNSSTTYYFIAGSTDESGNEATSIESSFITL